MSAAASAAGAPPAVANKGLITVSIMLATIMQVLDTTIANVALPSMQGSLGAAQDQITWVLTSYIVASAIMTPVTGWLSDRMGLRELFIASVAGFVVASMLCGMATSLTEMVVFRTLQGIFGAALVPLSQTVLLNINTPRGARPRDGDLGRRHHGRPDHRPDARRLADRDLQLALRLLRQPAGRPPGARRADRLPAAVGAAAAQLRLLRLRDAVDRHRRAAADARPRRAGRLVRLARDLDLPRPDDLRALGLRASTSPAASTPSSTRRSSATPTS